MSNLTDFFAQANAAQVVDWGFDTELDFKKRDELEEDVKYPVKAVYTQMGKFGKQVVIVSDGFRTTLNTHDSSDERYGKIMEVPGVVDEIKAGKVVFSAKKFTSKNGDGIGITIEMTE